MSNKAFGIINSCANHIRIQGMQKYRPIGAFSFLGRYRVIDFQLSNLSNSDIDQIQIYVRENPRSLTEHVRSVGTYDINSKRGKIQILFADSNNPRDIYNTDIAVFNENLSIVERMHHEYVIIVPSHMVYTQDYDELLEQHIESGADISLLYHRTTSAKDEFLRSDILTLNKQKGVKSIERNRGTAKDRNIFMETYVMKRELYIELVRKALRLSSIYTLSHIVNLETENLDIRGIPHKGYFAVIDTLKSYFDANLNLLDLDEANELFTPHWPIFTNATDSCPTQYFDDGTARNSVICNGCLIYGTVENSIVGRGAVIKKGAVVRNSVVLSHTIIGENVHIENQIVDKYAEVTHVTEIVSPPEAPGYIRREDII